MEKLNLQQRMRFVPTGMSVRENEDGSESRTIQGRAVVFNEETTLWDGKYYRVREIIDPSCVTAEFLKGQDIKLNLLHDREQSVARNNKGEGTLVLDLREDGLYFSAEMPKCDLGDRALELVRNKTYTGCSFEFYPQDYTEEVTTLEDGREDTLIRHTQFRAITALTIAMDPAYESTEVGVREQMEQREKSHITDEGDPDAEAKKREAEEQAAKEQAEREAREKFTRERSLTAMQVEVALANL